MIIEYDFKDGYHTALQVEFRYYEGCYFKVSPVRVCANSIGAQIDKDYKGFNIRLDEDFMKRNNKNKLAKLNDLLLLNKGKYDFINIINNQDIIGAKKIVSEIVASL